VVLLVSRLFLLGSSVFCNACGWFQCLLKYFSFIYMYKLFFFCILTSLLTLDCAVPARLGSGSLDWFVVEAPGEKGGGEGFENWVGRV
jgi:hypothetical protein